MRILLTTGGGDAPGLNAVIRAATLAALGLGWEVFGSRRGYQGLLEGGPGLRRLDRDAVRGITYLGGTILGTTNKGDPFAWPQPAAAGAAPRTTDRADEVVQAFARYGFDALVAIGGDGSLGIANRLAAKGIPVVGVPKTIDNDIAGTDQTFGFDTAVSIATDALGRLHSTAEAHDRVMVVEVMGRYAGFIALHSGLAATADVILIPEVPFTFEGICEKVMERELHGRLFSIIVCAEGARPAGGDLIAKASREAGRIDPHLGGVAEVVAREIAARTGKDTRTVVLGHVQRGGTPTSYDRLLALRFGAAAVRAIAAGRLGTMVAFRGNQIVPVPLAEALVQRQVDLASDVVATARALGISFGEAYADEAGGRGGPA